jgi:hypothetical protein
MLDFAGLESFLISNSNITKDFIIDFFGFQKKKLYEEYKPFIIRKMLRIGWNQENLN